MNPSPEPDSDAFVGVNEGAKIAGVSPNTLRRWAKAGRFPAYRTPGNRLLFKVYDLRNTIRPEAIERAS